MTTYELGALVLPLRVTRPTFLTNHLGRAVYAAGLKIIAQADPPLAQALHDDLREKPYAVTGLLRAATNQPALGKLEVGDAVWVRFSGLSAPVVAALTVYQQQVSAALAQGQPVWLELDYLPYEVTAATWEADWGGRTTYEALIDRYRRVHPPTGFAFRFVSATTFRSQTVNMPLPLPKLVFGNLVSRWERYTALRLRELPEEQVNQFIEHHLVISRHELATELYRFKNGSKEIGFWGSVHYEVLPKSAHLSKHQPELEALLQQEYVWFCRLLALLTDFAFYSQIGRKTTSGMGLVREGR